MSGGIFQPLGSLQDLDGPTRDPMWCYLCNERFEEPCLLDCFHAFCAQCLRGRASEGLISCPICSSPTKLTEGAALPPVDPILKFLVEVHGTEEKVFCANCDREASHKDCGPMCFCNTCSQPLCTQCKETTHSAKMFSKHDVVQLNNVRRLKETVKKCVQHGEPYIMFSLKKRDLLCIMCFRDTSVEDRAHCIDLETAYKNGRETLEQAVLSVQDLQSSVRDSIILLRALCEEVKTNAQQEQEDIKTLFEQMQEKLGERKEGLVEAVDTQYQEKSKAFKNQLITLAALLPTLQVNISSSKTFSLTANKYDFLDLGFVLIDRLMAIVHLPHQLSPTTSSKINCDHKVEFARCLEPLLGNGLAYKSSKTNGHASGSSGTSANGDGDHSRSNEDGTVDSLAEKCRTTALHLNSSLSICHGKYFNANSCKVFVDESGPFAEHSRNYDANYKILNDRVKKLKKDIQELHRDLTQRRCLTREQKVTNLMEECGQVDFTISTQYTAVEQMQSVFQKWWEECFQRVTHEQEMYQAQLKDLMRLKQETQHCTTIARQIAPFVKSIAAVKERIDPRLGAALRSEDHEGCMHAILEQINTMEPNSQQRVDAIRTAEESRDLALQSEASRPNPLEDSLIKTKGTLKPPKILPEKSRPVDAKEDVKDVTADTAKETQPHGSKDEQPSALPKPEEKSKKEPVVDKKDSLLKTGALLRKDENLKIGIPLICKEELAKAAAAAALKKEESKREESSKTAGQTPSNSKEEHNKHTAATTVKKEKEGSSKVDSEKTKVMSKEELAKAAASVALKMEENHKIEKECKA